MGQVGRGSRAIWCSAHNDIYGEIFRHLDQLAAGNEIIISTTTRDYTYVVEELRVVEPTETWVMAPTDHSQVTLISCFPYLIDTHRIVVFGRLVEPSVNSG
ncbi:MAG: sortase [Chloroflexota bacterium]